MTNLRDVLDSDRDLLRTWRNLPDVSQHMTTNHVITEKEHDRWFAMAMSDSSRRYWIIAVDGQPVGLANLYDIDTLNSRAQFAIYVADSEVRGRGAGSYALFTMMQVAFGDMGLHKLACEALATNSAALQMYEKFGFGVDGVLRDEIQRDGQFIDLTCLSIVSDEWQRKEPVLRNTLEARRLI